MKIPRKLPLNSFVVLVALYFFLASAAAVKIAIHETRCTRLLDQIAAKQDLNSVTAMDVNLNTRGMGFLTHFFLKLVYPEKSSAAKEMQNERDIIQSIAQVKQEFLASADASLTLFGFTLFFLLAANAGKEAGPEANQRRIYALLSISLIFFVLGISCPVLTAVVRGQHNLIGGFILETSSKGIVSTVITLIKSDDWIIAALLAGFSIGIPIFKGTATIVTCLGRSDEKRRKVARLLDKIGKWSLTDVLVAAVLLGCFSLNAIKQDSGGISAVPRFALGFFILYCVFAARTSYLLKGAVKSPSTEGGPGPGRTASAIVLASSLIAGAAFGYFIFDNFPFARDLGDIAVVKLVRTHTELINSTVSIDPAHPATIPFELPFRGTLSIRVKTSPKSPVEVNVVRDNGGENGAANQKPGGPPLPGFFAAEATSYLHSGVATAGKYNLTVRDNSPGDELQSVTAAYHITLDP